MAAKTPEEKLKYHCKQASRHIDEILKLYETAEIDHHDVFNPHNNFEMIQVQQRLRYILNGATYGVVFARDKDYCSNPISCSPKSEQDAIDIAHGIFCAYKNTDIPCVVKAIQVTPDWKVIKEFRKE